MLLYAYGCLAIEGYCKHARCGSQHPMAGMRLLPSTPPSVWNPCERKGRMIMTPDSNDAEDIIGSIDLVGTSGQSCWLAELIEPLLLLVQSGSTRPERIPASLAGLQQVNSKTLQDLQQHLQAHLTAAQKELRAQVTLLHVVWVEQPLYMFCKADCRIGSIQLACLLAGQHTASCNKSVHDFSAYTPYQGCSVH